MLTVNQVILEGISGATFPVNVYISDIYGNYLTLLGIINSGPVPPEIEYVSEIPTVFKNAPIIKLIMTDDNNCEIFSDIIGEIES